MSLLALGFLLIIGGAVLAALTAGILHTLGIVLAIAGVIALIIALVSHLDSRPRGPRV